MTKSRQVGLGAYAVAAIALGFAYVINNDPGENGDWRGYIVVLVVLAVITWLLFDRFVPRATGLEANTARSGLITSVLGLITVVAFWTGLPFVLGPAGALLGQAAKERLGERGGGAATAAVAIGVLAFVLAIAAVFFDELG